MNPLQILIAILLFGAGASTGYLVKSSQVAKSSTGGSAMNMLNSLPEGSSGRMSATTGIAFSMMHNDPQGTVAFVQSLPQGKSRHQTALNVSMNIARNDPQSGMALASGISDANQRSMAQQNVVRTWMRNDPAAATQWVNSSSLPQDVKTRLLQQK